MLTTTQRVDNLLNNDRINKSANDTHVCLWGSPCKTMQFRMDAGEVKAFIGRVGKTYTVANQKRIVEELAARTKKSGGMGDLGAVAIDSKSAAAALNAFAKKVGAKATFVVNKDKPAVPMG